MDRRRRDAAWVAGWAVGLALLGGAMLLFDFPLGVVYVIAWIAAFLSAWGCILAVKAKSLSLSADFVGMLLVILVLGSARQYYHYTHHSASGPGGSARMTVASLNAHRIVGDQASWSQAHDGKPCEDIAALLEITNDPYAVKVGDLISPLCDKELPWNFEEWSAAERAQWVRKNASYILVPDIKGEYDERKIVVFLRPEDSDGSGMAVAFEDGHSDWHKAGDARAIIEQQTGKTLEELIARQENYVPPAGP